MKKGFYVSDDGTKLLIQGDRQLLVLYPGEIIRAVLKDEELYIKANKRGKSERRIRTNEYRTNKRDAELQEQIHREEVEALKENV